MRSTHVVATAVLVAVAFTGCGAGSDDAATSPTGAVASEGDDGGGSDGSGATSPSATPSSSESSTTRSGTTTEGRLSGVVLWFNPGKGYGYVDTEGYGSIYVHSSAAQGFRLSDGQNVTFIIGHRSEQGRVALDVQLVE